MGQPEIRKAEIQKTKTATWKVRLGTAACWRESPGLG